MQRPLSQENFTGKKVEYKEGCSLPEDVNAWCNCFMRYESEMSWTRESLFSGEFERRFAAAFANLPQAQVFEATTLPMAWGLVKDIPDYHPYYRKHAQDMQIPYCERCERTEGESYAHSLPQPDGASTHDLDNLNSVAFVCRHHRMNLGRIVIALFNIFRLAGRMPKNLVLGENMGLHNAITWPRNFLRDIPLNMLRSLQVSSQHHGHSDHKDFGSAFLTLLKHTPNLTTLDLIFGGPQRVYRSLGPWNNNSLYGLSDLELPHLQKLRLVGWSVEGRDIVGFFLNTLSSCLWQYAVCQCLSTLI